MSATVLIGAPSTPCAMHAASTSAFVCAIIQGIRYWLNCSMRSGAVRAATVAHWDCSSSCSWPIMRITASSRVGPPLSMKKPSPHGNVPLATPEASGGREL